MANKPWLGKKLSEEHKKKISDGLKGTIFTEERKANIRKSLTGKQKSEEHNKHNSESKMGVNNPNYGIVWTEERKNKSRQKKLGHIVTQETRDRISINRTGKCCGEDNHRFGKPTPDWQKEIFRQRKLGLYDGAKHPQWRGGISKLPYPFEWNDLCRQQSRELFGYKCGMCGITIEEYLMKNQKNQTTVLHVHHIDYNKKNLDVDNLIPLCPRCHPKSNHNREYWKLVYERIMYFKLKENDGEGSILIPS